MTPAVRADARARPRARAVALLAGLALIAGACGGSGGHHGTSNAQTRGGPSTSGVISLGGGATTVPGIAPVVPGAGNAGAGGTGPSGTGPGGSATPGGRTTIPGPGDSGAGGQPGGSTSGGPSAGSSSTSAPTSGADGPDARATAARKAVDDYLATLVSPTRDKLGATSVAAAEAFAGIRLAIASYNTAQGATTTGHVQNESFSVTENGADRVVLSGSVTLSSEVSGPKGDIKSTITISGPVVVTRTSNGWRVDTFQIDGTPMVLFPEGGANQTIEGVQYAVIYVLSYSKVTSAVVVLAAQSGHQDVALDHSTLTTTSGSESPGEGEFSSDSAPVGVIRFARTDATPTRFESVFKRSDGHTLDYVIDLHGAPVTS